jgi:hypothetical protein
VHTSLFVVVPVFHGLFFFEFDKDAAVGKHIITNWSVRM